MITIYVPKDSAAVSVGADSVASAIAAEAVKRGQSVNIIRNGSRGMFFMEPLVEVATDKGRVAFGSVTASDVPSLFDAKFGAHPKALGLTEEIPYLKKQERLIFARALATAARFNSTTPYTDSLRISGQVCGILYHFSKA